MAGVPEGSFNRALMGFPIDNRIPIDESLETNQLRDVCTIPTEG